MGESTNQHDADALAAGYTAQHRHAEYGGIAVALITSGWLCLRLAQSPRLSGWWVPLEAFVGILLADWTSGCVHWMFDSWGGLDTPVLGKLAIRTFRHHHVDAKAITKHDFIETNAHNISLTTIYSVCGLLSISSENASLFESFVGVSLIFATWFTAFTSQIHKWAHMDRPPRIVVLLQRVRLILAPDHHSEHHKAPYHRNYCITVGWLNGPLRAMRVFETMEWMITSLTGAIPREDDLGKESALATLTTPDDEVLRARELHNGD